MGYKKHEALAVMGSTKAPVAGLSTVGPVIMLSQGLSVADGEKMLNDCSRAVKYFNLLLCRADDGLKQQEKRMLERNRHALNVMAKKHGDGRSNCERANCPPPQRLTLGWRNVRAAPVKVAFVVKCRGFNETRRSRNPTTPNFE